MPLDLAAGPRRGMGLRCEGVAIGMWAQGAGGGQARVANTAV